MTWTNGCDEDRAATAGGGDKCKEIRIKSCPSCGHRIQCHDQAAIHELPGLPAGVKFDPTDTELLEHLEGKVRSDAHKLHPLIDEFIPTLEGENGICYTHPEKLPGTITCVAGEDGETRLVMWGPRIVRRMMKCAQDIAFKEVPSWTILSRVKKDGLVRHFFHRPSKAYTTGTRKRRKVHTDAHGGETRWHKTGKTRPVFVSGKVKGYKKILVLYTNYGKQRKPEKTNWVMHQYHLGSNEEEKDGELVVSKVFYQTQPRQCGSGAKDRDPHNTTAAALKDDTAAAIVDYYNPSSLISYDQGPHDRTSPTHLIPNFVVHADGTSFLS